MVLQKVWVWVCLRNYIKNIGNIGKQSGSKWSTKKRTSGKARNYMGKMRIGWEKVQENVGQTIQMTHFLAIFLPFRFLLEKQRRSVKNCPNFSKNNFFTLFCQNFTCFSFISTPFHPISSPKPLFFFLRLDFATLNLPTGGRSSVPLTPLNGHSHSLVPLISLLFFLAYLLKILIKNLTFTENFHK